MVLGSHLSGRFLGAGSAPGALVPLVGTGRPLQCLALVSSPVNWMQKELSRWACFLMAVLKFTWRWLHTDTPRWPQLVLSSAVQEGQHVDVGFCCSQQDSVCVCTHVCFRRSVLAVAARVHGSLWPLHGWDWPSKCPASTVDGSGHVPATCGPGVPGCHAGALACGRLPDSSLVHYRPPPTSTWPLPSRGFSGRSSRAVRQCCARGQRLSARPGPRDVSAHSCWGWWQVL